MKTELRAGARLCVAALSGIMAFGVLGTAPAEAQTVRVIASTDSTDATGLTGGFVTVRATFADTSTCYDIQSVDRDYRPGSGALGAAVDADLTVNVAVVTCDRRHSNRLRFRVPHPQGTDVLNVRFEAGGRVIGGQRVQIVNRPRFTIGD